MKTLFDYVMNLPAVDAHEHLRPEAVRLGRKPDVLWLFHQYANSELLSAGMSADEVRTVMDTEGALDKRWQIFKPFYERIRHTGPAIAVRYALQDLYGCRTLDDHSYHAVSERILAENTPGMVDRFLHRRGHITAILNNNNQFEQPTSRCHAVIAIGLFTTFQDARQIADFGKAQGIAIVDLESYVAAIDRQLKQFRERGVVGLKFVCFKDNATTRKAAQAALKKLLTNRPLSPGEQQGLDHYLFQETLKLVPKYNFTVVVHCGYFSGANADCSTAHIRLMVPMLQQHPEVRFDLLHLSYPWIEEAIAIGKAFTNTSLNLTWCALLNPAATERAMLELINTVPINKVLAMGGDYWELPDVAYGHLRLARELLARSLVNGVADRRITVADARAIARRWLRENAREIYPLWSSSHEKGGHP